MPDFPDLIQRYVEKADQAAFAELVSGHVNLVYSVALRQMAGDAHLAEDVTQEVFLVLARKARSLIGRSTLNGWLYSTTVLSANATIRREQRRRTREQRAQSEEMIMPSQYLPGSGDADWEAARPMLDQAIGRLTDRERDAVLLRYFENRSFPEIGRVLMVSEDAARMRVERALEKLKVRLTPRGRAATTAAALATLLSSQAGMAAPASLAARVTRAAVALPYPTSAFTALRFVSGTKTAAGIIAVAGMLAVGLAWHETTIVHSTAAALADVDQVNADLKNRIQQIRESTRAILRAGETSMALGQANGARGLGGPKNERTAATKAAASRAYFNLDPKVHAMAGKLVAWNFATYFGPLLQSAGLSDARIARAEYLLSQSETFLNLGPTPISFKTDPRSYAEINAELVQVLGGAGVASLKTYDIVRHVTDVLAGSLFASDEPLTAQQASRLTEILADTNQGLATPGTWLNAQSTDWPAALTQAQSVLSPRQWGALKDLAISQFGVNLK